MCFYKLQDVIYHALLIFLHLIKVEVEKGAVLRVLSLQSLFLSRQLLLARSGKLVPFAQFFVNPYHLQLVDVHWEDFASREFGHICLAEEEIFAAHVSLSELSVLHSNLKLLAICYA